MYKKILNFYMDKKTTKNGNGAYVYTLFLERLQNNYLHHTLYCHLVCSRIKLKSSVIKQLLHSYSGEQSIQLNTSTADNCQTITRVFILCKKLSI